MTEPLAPPKRKDLLKNTRLGHVSPGLRSRAAKAMAVRAGLGVFALQTCETCGRATYPPRDRCPNCWGALSWQEVPDGAVIEAETIIRTSTDLFFREHLPWRIGTARLDAGPMAIVHLHGDVEAGNRVRLRLVLDRSGNPALFALPQKDTDLMHDDPQLRVFTAHPKHRRVLITDGRGALGQAVAKAMIEMGARDVYLGNADPLMRYLGEDTIADEPKITSVRLDLTDTASVQELANQLGGRVDIVINTSQMTRGGGAALSGKLTDLQAAMDVNVHGLMRLAQAFGPTMSGRSDDGVNAAAAFVDVTSIYGLTGHAGFSGMAATAAARLSLIAALRGEMQATGIRVLSILTGPLEDAWHQSVPPPKVTPEQVARAVSTALVDGLEMVPVGDVAKDVLARFMADPLLTIREENQ